MAQLSVVSRQTWVYTALAAAVALIVVTGVYQLYAGLLMALLVVVLVPVLLTAAPGAHSAVHGNRRISAVHHKHTYEQQVPLISSTILSPNGESHGGWVVSLEDPERLHQHRLVLTRHGYVLVDVGGRIIHEFKKA